MDHKTEPTFQMVEGPRHHKLAVLKREGRGPGLFWLGGYASDMRGTKASAIDAHAAEKGLACTRLDYSGHGESEGKFEEGKISYWAKDAMKVLDEHTEGPQILIGSSMGGWVAGLLARWRPERIGGLILIAPAPDFTDELMPHQLTQQQIDALRRDGRLVIPSDYDDSHMVYTRDLFNDGAYHLVLDQTLKVNAPVRILTGMADDVVPWRHVTRYADHIDSDDVVVTMVKAGDHRMSGPGELKRLFAFIDELTA